MRSSRVRITALFWIAACQPGPAPAPILVPPGTDRHADGLLEDTTLQRIVELQRLRDGAAIVPYLDAPDPLVRARAAFALGSVQYAPAVPALTGLLRDDDARVRADVAFALGQAGDSSAAAALLSAVPAEADRTVRHRLLEAIGKTGTDSVLAALVRDANLGPPDPARALAVGRFGIRNVHHEDAVAWLIGRFGAADPVLRRNAAYYFGRVRTTDPWVDRANDVRNGLAAATGDAAAMHLALGIGRLDDSADVAGLVAAAQHPDWRARVNALQSLGRFTDSAALSATLDGLGDVSAHVAVTAAGVLANTDSLPAYAIDHIGDVLTRPATEWPVGALLARALARQGAWEPVHLAIQRVAAADPRDGLRATLAAVAGVPDPTAFDMLATLADTTRGPVLAAALNGLGTRWQSGLAPQDTMRYEQIFRRGLDATEAYVAVTAVRMLGRAPFRERTRNALIDRVRRGRMPGDTAVMAATLAVLARDADPEVLALLRNASTHADPGVSRTARRALDDRSPSERIEDVPELDWRYLRTLGPAPHLVLETTAGTLTLQLLTEEAPLTMQTITRLASAGRYDGVAFHRVVPNFVIQGGDVGRGDGSGGPSYRIRSEFTRVPYERGVLGMARGGKDTEGSQFFVTHVMTPHLDGAYTAFGWVIDGWSVLDRMQRTDRVVTTRVVESQ